MIQLFNFYISNRYLQISWNSKEGGMYQLIYITPMTLRVVSEMAETDIIEMISADLENQVLILEDEVDLLGAEEIRDEIENPKPISIASTIEIAP